MSNLDPVAIADQILPLDGPYTPEAVRGASTLIAELVRHLNHATRGHATEQSLPYPDYVDRLVGNLGQATKGLAQLADQLADHMETLGQDPRLRSDDLGARGKLPPETVAASAAAHLVQAHDVAGVLAAAFTDAGSFSSHLGWRDNADD